MGNKKNREVAASRVKYIPIIITGYFAKTANLFW